MMAVDVVTDTHEERQVDKRRREGKALPNRSGGGKNKWRDEGRVDKRQVPKEKHRDRVDAERGGRTEEIEGRVGLK